MNIAHRRRIALRCAVLIAATYGAGIAGTHIGAAQTRAGAVAAAASPAGAVMRLHQRLVRITIDNYTFEPARLVVSPGTRIIWTNHDGDPHTVSSTKGAWGSNTLDTNAHFARVFKQTGTFSYYCSIHPFMHGAVIVKK